jgi:hypothetical protein
MNPSLRKLFQAFMASLPGCESIDELLRESHEKRKRADYLLRNRQVIVEVKTLEVDQFHRTQTFIDRLNAEGRVYAAGRHWADTIYRGLPDELKRKMLYTITKGLEDDAAHADRQTRYTREIFSIPNALGVLVVLNDGAPTLSPALISYGLGRLLEKKRPDGSLRYTQNDGVIMFSATHVVPEEHGGQGMPCFMTANPSSRLPQVFYEFGTGLMADFARFLGIPTVKVTKEAISDAERRE